jgi:Arc/MetJ family transcription regulator
MRTNIEPDDGLVSEGFSITGLKTKKDLVDFALRELIRQKARKKMISMRGKFQWQGDLGKSRENRFP